jgi:hypothetical protein
VSRAGAIAARAALENPDAPDALLAFLTITHPGLADPIRVVSDVIDYLRDGVTYVGIPFEFKPLTDRDGNPMTQLRMSNVDRRLAQAIRGFTGRPTVALELCSTADFDLSVQPREPVGAVAAIYAFHSFSLVNIIVTATDITAEVILQDYGVEPWPAIRATQDRLPGLFR